MLTIHNLTRLADHAVIPAAMQLYEGGEHGTCKIKVEGLDLGVKYLSIGQIDFLYIYNMELTSGISIYK